jgi:hypothetical protein
MPLHDEGPSQVDVVPPLDEVTRRRLTAQLLAQPPAHEPGPLGTPVIMPRQLDDDITNGVVRDLARGGQIPALELARAAVRIFDLEYEGLSPDDFDYDLEDEPGLEGDWTVRLDHDEDPIASAIRVLPSRLAMEFDTVGERSMLRAIVRRIVAEADRGPAC